MRISDWSSDVCSSDLWYFVDDPALALEAAPFEASAEEVDGGYRVVVTAAGLVKDLTLLADKVDPGAHADTALLTLLPGESVEVAIRARAGIEPSEFIKIGRAHV